MFTNCLRERDKNSNQRFISVVEDTLVKSKSAVENQQEDFQKRIDQNKALFLNLGNPTSVCGRLKRDTGGELNSQTSDSIEGESPKCLGWTPPTLRPTFKMTYFCK